MAFSRPRWLSHVDGDEVSLVRAAANKRRFLLTKGDEVEGLDPELADILQVPAPNEGAIIDLIRKDGADAITEDAIAMAMRLTNAVTSDLSPETIEKLGSQMYAAENRPLNTGHGIAGEPLNGSYASGPNVQGADTDNDDDANWDTDEDEDQQAVGKRDVSTDERKNLASSGKALPDGSFPIANTSDLKNAVQAFGRAKDKGKAKAFIIRRAKALGATNLLPDSWAVSKEDDQFVNDEQGGGTVETHAVPIQKEDGTWDLSGVPADARPFYESVMKQADETKAELDVTKEKLQKSEEKTGELAETLKKKEFIQKAEEEFPKVGPAEDLAEILKAASESFPEELFEKFETLLKANNAQIDAGDLYAELGRASRGESQKPGSAYAEAVAKAEEMVEKGDGTLTKDEAIGRVFEMNPALYDRYQAENPAHWAVGPVDASVAQAAANYFSGGDS